MRPKFIHSAYQSINFFGPVNRRRCEPQPLSSTRHRREVDWLHVNTELIQQHVGQLLGVYRIADNHRHNVAAMVYDGQAQTFEPQLQDLGLCLVLFWMGSILRTC